MAEALPKAACVTVAGNLALPAGAPELVCTMLLLADPCYLLFPWWNGRKKCLDFTATAFMLHLFFCLIFRGFPTSSILLGRQRAGGGGHDAAGESGCACERSSGIFPLALLPRAS